MNATDLNDSDLVSINDKLKLNNNNFAQNKRIDVQSSSLGSSHPSTGISSTVPTEQNGRSVSQGSRTEGRSSFTAGSTGMELPSADDRGANRRTSSPSGDRADAFQSADDDSKAEGTVSARPLRSPVDSAGYVDSNTASATTSNRKRGKRTGANNRWKQLDTALSAIRTSLDHALCDPRIPATDICHAVATSGSQDLASLGETRVPEAHLPCGNGGGTILREVAPRTQCVDHGSKPSIVPPLSHSALHEVQPEFRGSLWQRSYPCSSGSNVHESGPAAGGTDSALRDSTVFHASDERQRCGDHAEHDEGLVTARSADECEQQPDAKSSEQAPSGRASGRRSARCGPGHLLDTAVGDPSGHSSLLTDPSVADVADSFDTPSTSLSAPRNGELKRLRRGVRRAWNGMRSLALLAAVPLFMFELFCGVGHLTMQAEKQGWQILPARDLLRGHDTEAELFPQLLARRIWAGRLYRANVLYSLRGALATIEGMVFESFVFQQHCRQTLEIELWFCGRP